MSSDALTWIAQELSFTCLEEDERGLRALAGTLPSGVNELGDAAARLAGMVRGDPARIELAALLERARRGERGALEVEGGRIVAWSAGGRARVLFAPRDEVTNRKAAVAERAAGVTHELANALTAIAGWTRMAATGGPLPERTRHALEVVQQSARDALGTARGLLGVMRDAAQRTIPAPPSELASASAVIAEVLETLRPQLEEAKIRLETDVEADVTSQAPRLTLQLIASNLVKNALEALSPGGSLRVALREEEGELRLTVADDGLGMSAATLAQVFDRYFTTKPRGTGLGLASVAAAVREAGGRIETESCPGVGTSFEVWLPLAAGAAPPATPPRKSGVHPRPALDGEPVLVVDDDEAIRALVQTALELQGALVHTAAGTEEALEHGGPFALALIDLSLGAERGDALLARLRSEGRVARAILITGAPDSELEPESAPDAVLRKPFELEELVRAIEGVIEVRALGAEG